MENNFIQITVIILLAINCNIPPPNGRNSMTLVGFHCKRYSHGTHVPPIQYVRILTPHHIKIFESSYYLLMRIGYSLGNIWLFTKQNMLILRNEWIVHTHLESSWFSPPSEIPHEAWRIAQNGHYECESASPTRPSLYAISVSVYKYSVYSRCGTHAIPLHIYPRHTSNNVVVCYALPVPALDP